MMKDFTAQMMNDQPTFAGDNLVRRLGARYVFVLFAVVALIVTDQLVIQPLLLRMNDYAPVINTAGRQRMLSQKLAKAALAIQLARDDSTRAVRRTELRESLGEWATAHKALQLGDVARGIARVTSPAIDAAWTNLQPHFAAMQQAATLLGQQPAEVESAAEMSSAVTVISDHEQGFLATMDRIVSLMESQAEKELWRLRMLALTIAGAIVLLVGGLGCFVIQPATRAMRGQVDILEQLVSQRTRRLNDMLAALRDEIAEREASEARNRALAAQLAHANRVDSMGHLATGLAHELNQPLGAIVNYTEACGIALDQPQDSVARAKLQGLIERVRVAALRAGGIVRGIRNFVRPGPNSLMPVELVALVRDVVELCRPEAHRTETVVSFEPPTNSGIVVNVDPIQIQQVLVNLIQNAIHALTDLPAQERRIILQIESLAETAQIDVIDNGPGIGEMDADELFAPFHTTKSDGLGIGLSICRSIVEQHHGTIWAQSLSPRGTQFSFVLPRIGRHAADYDRQTDGVCR
jgi:two-component system sensor kinase FixL